MTKHILFITVIAEAEDQVLVTVKMGGKLLNNKPVQIDNQTHYNLSIVLAKLQRDWDLKMLPHQGHNVGYAMFGPVTEEVFAQILLSMGLAIEIGG